MSLSGPIDSKYETQIRSELEDIFGGEISEEIESTVKNSNNFDYKIKFKQIATREMRHISAGVNVKDGLQIEILEKGPWRS